MSDIVLKIKEEIIRRSNEFYNKTKGTKDEYNLYEEHVKYVFNYVNILAKDKDVDLEVVQLSALLHDIAMTDIALDRSRHNEYGALIAESLLKEYNYPLEKIELVKKCIYNHSNKRKDYRTTLEENILVNADGLAHFDAIDSIYSLAHLVIGLSEEESIQFVRDKLTKDYNEINEEVRLLVKEKYNKVMEANSYDDIKLSR